MRLFDMSRPTKQTITAHISRMEAANSIGNIHEWESFKKTIEALQEDNEKKRKDRIADLATIKRNKETIKNLKYKLRAKNV